MTNWLAGGPGRSHKKLRQNLYKLTIALFLSMWYIDSVKRKGVEANGVGKRGAWGAERTRTQDRKSLKKKFQKLLDKLPKLWYNKITRKGKEDREGKPKKNQKGIIMKKISLETIRTALINANFADADILAELDKEINRGADAKAQKRLCMRAQSPWCLLLSLLPLLPSLLLNCLSPAPWISPRASLKIRFSMA